MRTKLKKSLRALSALTVFAGSGNAIAQSVNHIEKMVVLELPGLTSSAGQGAYANVYSALQNKKLVKRWFSAPSRRSHSIFLNKEANCIAPASLDLVERYGHKSEKFSITIPFNKAVGKVMTAVSPPTKEGGKPVMGVVGFGVQHGVEPGLFKIEDLPDYNKLLQLVEENRIDAAYIVYPDVEQVPGSIERIRNFKGKIDVRWKGTDSILCWKEFAPAVKLMSHQLQIWQKNEHLQTLLGAYHVE